MGPHVNAVLAVPDDAPSGALRDLQRTDQQASSYSLLLTARLLQLVAAFEHAGVPVIALKGPALAQQLYGDAAMRDSLDLDLLVPSSGVELAAAVLGEHGYRMESELSWLGLPRMVATSTEVTYRHDSGTGVDLHWASAPSDHPFAIPAQRLWSSTTTVAIAGRPVPVLSAECQLVYLAIHGTRHCWTKLRWLCDLAMLVSGQPSIDWSEVRAIADEAQASRALALGMCLAQDLLGAEVPEAFVHGGRSDRAVAAAAVDVRCRLTACDPRPQPTPVQRTLFNARLAARAWLKARHVAALMKAPTDADAAVHLPRSLVFLYYPLRAARLVAKHGRAMVTE